MVDLTAAHRGYEYQDLLAAAWLVDVMLRTVVEAHVDVKLVPDDRFDDLTTVDATGHRERIQVKHTENEDQPLTLATFTSDARSLRLDRLVAAAVTDRDGAGAGASESTFRVVLRDAPPLDGRLLAVLGAANPDPGPFLRGMPSLRMRFDPEALWHESATAGTERKTDTSPFSFLREGDTSVARPDLEWVCERLVIEVEAPAASRDLTAPGPAEHLLLARVREEIGAELYPNTDRSAVDVAEALIRTARSPVRAAWRSPRRRCCVGPSFVRTSGQLPVPIPLTGPSKWRGLRRSKIWFERRTPRLTTGGPSWSSAHQGKVSRGYVSK